MRVFWPRNIEQRSGTAVGWRMPASAGGKATVALVVVDVVNEFAVDTAEQWAPMHYPLERLGRVLSPSQPADADDFTIWVDAMPIGYSQPAETVLFTPRSELTLPSEEGRLAEYGAAVQPTDIRGLLMRLSTVASAQNVLRGHSSMPPMSPMIGPRGLMGTWLCIAIACMSLRCPFNPMTMAVACATAASTFLLTRAVLRPPQRLAFLRAMQSLAHLPLQAHSAFMRQVARRALAVAAAIDGPSPLTTKAPHSAPVETIQADMALGAVATTLLLAYPLHPILPNITDIFSSPVIAALWWLNDWPFGLKLNTGLSAFLCDSIARVLEIWREIATPVVSHVLPHIPVVLAAVSLLGVSFGVALLSDLLALLTLHLRLIHLATAALSRVSMTALLGLWDLFRGRRWNVLRHRTDSHAFEVDTLFLGTLLFTVTAFLAPTVLAYALLFALVNFAILVVQRALALAIAGINCSVLFRRGLMCDGIVFEAIVPETHRRAPDAVFPVQHVLELKSTPMGDGALFRSWWRNAKLAAH
ncbi:hypothetical protein CspeluHIS016_0802080 [Cutaneotrichosporon spelunceum]|uniref:Gpi1-domain-containing protein n=1 Tax=Cutaneotrichosporon spelunceum TaxID=1672016 RepID=A0AAD3YF50_9TREE|nr:hypothetical protein CspeluHIS016_0802080 [Cutaneotrichosporon spelunceum]